MANAAINKKKALFTSNLHLYLRKKLMICYIWSLALHGAELGSMPTNDARYTCEIKSRIAMAKAEFNKKKNNLFTSKLDLNLRKKLVKC